MRTALAAASPWWEPGTAHGYHVNTFGFLVGAVVERVTGQPVGTYLRERRDGPIGATCTSGSTSPTSAASRSSAGRCRRRPRRRRRASRASSYALQRVLEPVGLSGAGVVNTRSWRLAQHPSTNAHATARGVARLYDALVRGQGADGRALAARDALVEATSEAAVGEDLVLERPSRFGLGFQLTMPERPIGRSALGYGHFGAGGSVGFCDPEGPSPSAT